MSKSICVAGTGYVGLIAAVGLADFGNTVIAVDSDKGKIDKLSRGVPSIYEPGVHDYLERNIASGRLSFTTDLGDAVRRSEVVFIAVGTPEKDNGEAELGFIESVADEIAANMNGYKVVVTKSTVPVGTNRMIKARIAEKSGGDDFDVVSNPEFLREGRATEDFFHPDRIVIGFESERAKGVMFEVYRALNLISVPFLWCGIETAELIKYASNAFLATKISFINEMANLAESVGADIHLIARSMGMDGRISPKFLHPGPGFGGSCFPKDTNALVQFGRKYGVEMSLIEAVISVNEKQKHRIVEKLHKYFDSLKNVRVGVLGLAFKQRTDDIRRSPSITVVDEILAEGGSVQAHDPKAMDNFSELFPDVLYCHSTYDAVKGADALVLMTEWNEYRGLELGRLRELMSGNVIIDARNLLDPESVKAEGFRYEGIGRK